MKIPQSFFSDDYATNCRDLLQVKTKCSPLDPLLPVTLWMLKSWNLRSRIQKCQIRCLVGTLPQMFQIASSQDRNVIWTVCLWQRCILEVERSIFVKVENTEMQKSFLTISPLHIVRFTLCTDQYVPIPGRVCLLSLAVQIFLLYFCS